MLDKIEQQVKRSGTAISIHKFKSLKNKSDYVFLFVEGEDDLYFYPQNAKNMFIDKHILPLSCCGKDGVIEVHDILVSDMTDEIVAGFFVDKDFDDEKNKAIPENIYITPTYSVENLVYNQDTYVNLLLGRFGLIPTEASFMKCLELYEILSNQFYSSIHLYNSWIYAQRNLITADKKLNLPKNLPKNFVSLKPLGIECGYNLNTIEATYPEAPKVSSEIMNLASEALNNDKPEFRFRGKFNWQFFAHIISLLIEDANNKSKRSYINNSVKFNVAKKDSRKFFEEISPFAKPPECLLKYMDSMAA